MKYILKNPIIRFYTNRNGVEQILMLCSAFSMALLTARIIYTGHILFLFLPWNLFLAWIPYALCNWMTKMSPAGKTNFLILVFAWILLIPNSFYIITDLFHLDMNQDIPLWFDLVLLLSFAWSGLLFGIISVRQMEKLFVRYFSSGSGLIFILPVMALNALGVYIGRYLRFNSWDILVNPFQLAQDIIYLFIHPIRNRFDWSMIVCYSILMTLIYVAVKRMSKVF